VISIKIMDKKFALNVKGINKYIYIITKIVYNVILDARFAGLWIKNNS